MFLIFRVDFSYDAYKLVEGRNLWLGGIKIEHSMGLLGYSDVDVLIHVIYDVSLGVTNMHDIGYHSPDTSDETLSMGNKMILQEAMALIATKGYQLGSVDATACAEQSKINPHIPTMKSCLARLMQADEGNISIEATTNGRMGSVGRQEGMAAYTTILIVKA